MEKDLNKQNKKKIVLIEDDEFLSDMLIKKLCNDGLECSLFKTASEAFDSLRTNHQQEHISLILLDMILPEMSGFEFLQKAKDDPKISSVPIIVLSNLGQDDEIKKAKELGARDYIIKANFSLEEIVKKVRDFLKI